MRLFHFAEAALGDAWVILIESAPYLLFGFLAAGLLHEMIRTDAVGRHLGKGGIGSVIKAALFGIPLPLCSCGVLPAALGLRRKGASKGATVAFLVSTPETGVDSIALTCALMDPVMTVFRPLAAFVTAVLAGAVEDRWGGEASAGAVAACGCSEGPLPRRSGVLTKVRDGLRYAFGDLLGDLAPWLAAGFLLAGVISALIPDDWVGTHLGSGPVPHLVMLAVGIPLYVCATASTPIAAALVLKGLSPGAALVFLLAGPATNLAALTALAGTLGLGTTARYLGAIAVGALGMGLLLDAAYPALGISPRAVTGAAGELFSPAVGTGAVMLLAILGLAARLPLRNSAPPACSGAT